MIPFNLPQLNMKVADYMKIKMEQKGLSSCIAFSSLIKK